MNKYKICVYAVCKNEEKFVERFMKTLNEADLVIIGDTGSTDNTIEKFRANGAIVHSIPVNPWRFDEARNKLLKLIPNDVDICVTMDVDEIIEPGWRESLEKVWTSTTTRGSNLYTWSHNADGSPGVQYIEQRIHSRHGFIWIYPTHEVLEYIGENEDIGVFIDGLKIDHYPDATKDRGFNLELLELALKEFPNDCRNLHYLGREYMFAKRYDESIEILKKYLNHPKATWNEERSASMSFIGICYNAKGNYQEAKFWLLKAINETPFSRDSYIELAFLSYAQKEWSTVYFAVTEALKITYKNTLGYPNDPRGWNSNIYDLGSIACFNIGQFAKSLEYAKIALELDPDNERLKKNIKLISNEIKNDK